ncbi:ribonuclease H-like domain-containing protein [Tanacetum coccineum]
MVVDGNINKSGDDANKKHDDIGSSYDLNWSFSDTLYLHPNDTSGSPIVLVPGIDESYLEIRSNILTRETLHLVKAAFAIIIGEESHRNVTSVGVTKPAATAFAAKIFDNKRMPNNNSNFNKGSGSNSNSNNKGPNLNLKCTNCNKIGHNVDKYFELVGYPAGYVKRNFNSSTWPLSRLMNLLNDNGVSFANANVAGNVDSRVNQHMIVSAKFLVNVVDISNLGLTVGTPNGTQALITKIGDLKISNDITLYDVLLVLEYTISLLSVHKIAKDSKLFVRFDDEKCYIQDLRANKIVGIGNQCNGFFMFDVDNACKIVSNNCISSWYVSKTLWHQRLGHPADRVLDVHKSSLNLDCQSVSDHLCDTCNKTKQTREPFPLSDHKSTKIGQLVHLDVWGPYEVVSIDDFRYFLTIVYDFCRDVWVYMHKGKMMFMISLISSFVLSRKSPFYFVHGHYPSLSHFKDINHKNFFDNENPKRPNDDGTMSSYDDDTELSYVDQNADDSRATSIYENTHPVENVSDETDLVGTFYENSKLNS